MAGQPTEISDNNDDAEFQAEFARLDAARNGRVTEEEPTPEVIAAPEGNAPEDDEPAANTPPAKSSEDGTSGDGTDGGDKPPEVEASDPWKDVPDDLRERIKQIEKERDDALHRARSDAQRVAALSRKLQTSAPVAPAKAEPTEAQKALDQKMKQLQEDYPEIAEPVIEMLAMQREQLGTVTQQLETVAQDRHAAFVAHQQALLEQVHPDWQVVASSPDFQQWMATQPEGLQKLGESYDARETSTILGLFKTEAGIAARAAAPLAPTPERQAADARRRDQLDGGKEVKSRSAPAASGPPDDYEGAAAYYAAKKDREMLQQRGGRR